MGKFIETKLSERNVKIAKRSPANLDGKPIGKGPKRPQSTEPKAGEKVPSADFQDLSFKVDVNPVSGSKCVRLINSDCDLFAVDDLKAR